ncbi:DUF1707 domain-containing protein [Salinibacterium sp. NYA9b]
MNHTAEHPLVTSYLSDFDDLAAPLSSARRLELREEIASHLRESIPVAVSNADAAAVIAAFGSPAEILGDEGIPGQGRPASRSSLKRRQRVLIAAAIVIAGLVLAIYLWFPGPQPAISPQAPQSSEGPASVVNEDPTGPARVTEGTAYFEYLAAIEAMPETLPSGAAYPAGVPEGLDSGQTDGGVVQSGLGATVAHFTWLCAWEAEYLTAADDEDAERLVAAEAMLTQWPSYDFVSDPDGGWAANVLEPLSFGDTAGLQRDFPQTCAQAGILNVTAP